MIGDLGDVNAIQRRDGFFDVVDKNKDIVEVVARVSTEWNADKAFAGLTNALQANPDIDFLFTSSDFMLPQIQQVLETFDKWHKIGEDGHVLLGGFDGDANAYQLIADNYMDACGVQNLFLEVDMAFQAFQDMWAGKKPEKLLLDPGFVITQANKDQTRDQMWGYIVWTEERQQAVTCLGGAVVRPPRRSIRGSIWHEHGRGDGGTRRRSGPERGSWLRRLLLSEYLVLLLTALYVAAMVPLVPEIVARRHLARHPGRDDAAADRRRRPGLRPDRRRHRSLGDLEPRHLQRARRPRS